MSVQFGKCSFDGKPVDPRDLDRVRPVLTPYGPDAEGYFCKDNVGILYRAFHTTKESHNEVQPYLSKSGAVMTWDGRLDNRKELIDLLGGELSPDSTDLSIVAAAYELLGRESFARLIGDWAISIWDPRTRSLILAKDFVGTRHLYYSVENGRVSWCSILDPLVLFADRSLVIDEEYIAGWLSFFPAPHLTPYAGIHAVPPSCFVRLAKGTRQLKKYWDFNPAKQIRYRIDAEYEEHFRSVFAESIRCRLRSDTPVLAELSGGMDSSSIVCMADEVIRNGDAETPRLDTLSYYDDSEPNWNERPFFAKVEAKRGRTGYHIDVSSHEPLRLVPAKDCLMTTPGSRVRTDEAAGQFATYLVSKGNRAVLSGIGGDEVMGGVPTPIPELADLIARARLKLLAHQLKVWALNKRKPWVYLFLEAARGFLPPRLAGAPTHLRPAPWLHPKFVKTNRAALSGYASRVQLFGPRPSFQDSIATLDALRRQMECFILPAGPIYEKRYPYLDRDLLEFVYSVGPEQLVRPGSRRSLMRRALAGIVPEEILNRKRKAFVARAPLSAISSSWAELTIATQHMVMASLEIIDGEVFCETLRRARTGCEAPMVIVMRTLDLELWLRNLRDQGVLSMGQSICPRIPADMLSTSSAS